MARQRKAPPLSGMSGKELVRKLRDSGTGETKLNVGRELLTRKPNASAEAVFAAMEEAGVCEGTLEKAEQIISDGEYTGPKQPESETPVEDLPDDEGDETPAPKAKTKSPSVVQGPKESAGSDFKPANFVETPPKAEAKADAKTEDKKK